MKRNILISIANDTGAIFVRHGSKHDIYENPRTHEYAHIPRHNDINEYTAKEIIKKLSK